MFKKRPLLATVLFAITSAVPVVADDMPGVTATEIKIGNTDAYSGPASAYGAIAKLETAFFKMVNDQGGVAGTTHRNCSVNSTEEEFGFREKLLGEH